MCALMTYIKLSIYRNIFLEIEKIVITFSIPKKIFSQIKNLIYTLKIHVNPTHK